MQTTQRRRLFLSLYLSGMIVASIGMLGCDQGCDVDATCIPPGWSGPIAADDCPADPADGPVRLECGIWVSTSLGGGDLSGTQDAPVQTLAKALELAQIGPKRVYACGETFAEAVKLPSGVSLYGGFDCVNRWTYSGMAKRASIISPPGSVALTMMEGDAPSFVADVNVRSADAVQPGGSSIAVLVQDKTTGWLRRADVVAGDGADGQDGDDDAHGVDPPTDGLPGNNGADACTANPGFGGQTVTLLCPDGGASTGGAGGDSGELVATDGSDGLPSPGLNAPFGLGGDAETAALTCTPGLGGQQGIGGADGVPMLVATRRTITKEGLVLGGDGGDGAPGQPGQGGGGGGASFGKVAVCGASPPGGAGGGSGGTGGCGGRGGRGGQTGGSSIGLAVRGTGVRFQQLRISSSTGGHGGRGGPSQPGGQGGLPGAGGQGVGGMGGVQSGCGGGIGGNGGNGGNGAGGRGGDSVAVATVGFTMSSNGEKADLHYGAPGLGGLGGDPSTPEQNALPGTGASGLMFDP